MLEDLSLKSNPTPTIPTRQRTLQTLNLDVELAENYHAAKAFLENLDHYDTPANQVAQVMNTINSILKEIVKMQTDLYDAERVKKLEAALIETMKAQAPEVQRTFFEAYEQNLAR